MTVLELACALVLYDLIKLAIRVVAAVVLATFEHFRLTQSLENVEDPTQQKAPTSEALNDQLPND